MTEKRRSGVFVGYEQYYISFHSCEGPGLSLTRASGDQTSQRRPTQPGPSCHQRGLMTCLVSGCFTFHTKGPMLPFWSESAVWQLKECAAVMAVCFQPSPVRNSVLIMECKTAASLVFYWSPCWAVFLWQRGKSFRSGRGNGLFISDLFIQSWSTLPVVNGSVLSRTSTFLSFDFTWIFQFGFFFPKKLDEAANQLLVKW